MIKKLLLVLAILAVMVGRVWATAWTEDASAVGTTGIINATPADTTTSYTCSKTGYLASIEWSPTAANDILWVRNGSATGPIIARFKSADGITPQIKYFSGRYAIKPVIAYTDNTLTGTIGTCHVDFEFAKQP